MHYRIFSYSRLQITLFLLHTALFSCSSSGQVDKQGAVLKINRFYNEEGKSTFIYYSKVRYKDSISIQEVTGMNTVSGPGDYHSVTYPLLFCRYIDLRNKTLYDYKTFSDTARIINKTLLPDSVLKDGGWNFYSEKAHKITGVPEPMTDTVIENITFKRAKFCFHPYDPAKRYFVGYFRCDRKGDMFSLEKDYSRQIDCTMVKFFDFRVGKEIPVASKEVFFTTDRLTDKELKVFDAWEKNARENPVNK